jgi:hypothetical protein
MMMIMMMGHESERGMVSGEISGRWEWERKRDRYAKRLKVCYKYYK